MKVGVFDSGLGGLGTVSALARLRPNLDIIYFGDTARLPYGTRSREAVRRYAAQDAAFLLKKGVDAILIACGTASSAALPDLSDELSVPVYGVVRPAAREAVQTTQNRKIGVLGTQGTIASGSYERAIRALMPEAQITAVACPLLVPFVENGEAGSDLCRMALMRYLEAPKKAGCDTLLLGCTHYPLLKDDILALWPEVKLIDASAALARDFAEKCPDEGEGRVELFTSDFSQGFFELAERFLPGGRAHFAEEKVAVETWN
ncbi:MAG: glutamate racemase [Clostridia bacterium]|nr:glutamate racemase [Clostridia bacterium]